METPISCLDDLGPRICIMGPSNSGKSTLAAAIARASDRTAIYLDQLRFSPNTDWVMRPDDEFIALHDEAITGEAWVCEGNYSNCLPQRLARATGVIMLETTVSTSLWRYVRRCWFEKNRSGALEGSKDSVKWEMIRWIAWDSPQKVKKYVAPFDNCKLPKIKLSSQQEMDSFYELMMLKRPE